MSSSSSTSAGAPATVVIPAALERHAAGLRTYLSHLPGAVPAEVEKVVRDVLAQAAERGGDEAGSEVGLFAEARRRAVGAGHRGDVILADEPDDAGEEEAAEKGDTRMRVHRAFARLTPKQQEVVRLKFQFGLGLDDLARITGVSPAAVSSLLHFALERVCGAVGIQLGSAARAVDARLTAYALDELSDAERRSFAESAGDGKSLLENVEAIRRVGAQLTQILKSGAPLPRRRRKRAAAGWRSPGVILGAIAAAAVLGIVAWRLMPSAASTRGEASPADSAVIVRGLGHTAFRKAEGEARASGGHAGDLADRESDWERSRDAARAGQSDWERKSFGGGSRRPGNSDGDRASPATARGEEGALTAAGGERSPGAAFGPASSGAPTAERRGREGKSENAGGAAGHDDDETTSDDPGAPADAAGRAATAGEGRAQSAGDRGPRNPLADLAIEKKTFEPRGAAAGKTNPPPEPTLAELRQQLAEKHWPKSADVSLPEMLRQVPPEHAADSAAPESPLATQVEVAPSPWQPGRFLARITVRAKPAPRPSRPPANLVFAIDVSQSMSGPNRLPLVQEGIRLLAERLRPEDHVAVVTYAAKATEVLPGVRLGEQALELRNCLTALRTSGLTNGSDGLERAYAVAARNRVANGVNLVILCTDGNFNLGETDESVLGARAAREAAQGIRLSVFGFGRSDRNDVRLELLAAYGKGRSCYVNTREEADRLLAGQVDGLLDPVARDVDVAVAFDRERIAGARRLEGNEAGSASVDELLPGRRIDSLHEIVVNPKRADEGRWVEVAINFRPPGSQKRERDVRQWEGAIREAPPASPGFRFAMAWAEFGRILRAGSAAAGPDLARLESWVKAQLPDEAGGYRQELLDNIAVARLAVP